MAYSLVIAWVASVALHGARALWKGWPLGEVLWSAGVISAAPLLFVAVLEWVRP